MLSTALRSVALLCLGGSIVNAALPTVDEATAASLIYFYPLTQYAKTFGPLFSAVGTNAFQHQNYTSAGSTQPVVRSNIDTVYSRAIIDLSTHDIELSIPEISYNRTHVFPFHDFYGNDFANIGSFNNASAGSWLLRPGQTGQTAIELTQNSTTSNYTGYVNFPTTYGAMFPRLLLLNQPSDTAAIKSIQSQMQLKPVPRKIRAGADQAPKLTAELIDVSGLSKASYSAPYAFDYDSVTALFKVVQQVAPYNLPVTQTSVNTEVLLNLSIAGVPLGAGAGCTTYRAPCGLNLTSANSIVQKQLADLADDPTLTGTTSPQWNWPLRIGDFGLDFAHRCQITFQGYLGLTIDQVVYNLFIGGVTTSYGAPRTASRIEANESLVIHFDSKPPIASNGFWSITVYDKAGYLVVNNLDRFGLGDRSNMTYPDGQRVYGGDDHADGAFEMVLQPASRPPPSNWTSNWVPTPPAGEYFFISLRMYGALAAATTTWQYPNVSIKGIKM